MDEEEGGDEGMFRSTLRQISLHQRAVGNCLKVYHPHCVGKDESCLESGEHWFCGLHSCLMCYKTSKFQCFCCPNAFCAKCINSFEFVKIDFKDRETREGLFKEYWDIVKEKEGLTLDDIHAANKSDLVVDESKGAVKRKPSAKSKISKKEEFIGWASKPLIEFLKYTGKDTTKQMSQYEVDAIVKGYIQEKNLFHPENKHKRTVSPTRKYQEEETDQKEADMRSCFASIISDNIKLIYLRRSLVEELSKQPENFEEKVVGSFVRVKTDPRDYRQKNSHQLLTVTGVQRSSTGEILLKCSRMSFIEDFSICMLSDSDFTEEECQDFGEKIAKGVHKKLTVVEVEEKAKILHADITKHVRIDYATIQEKLLQELPKVTAEALEAEIETDDTGAKILYF
uniref:Plus3 domain-containing protein n=1 Tax=Cannabis sativa TaxID=3483 RepID=A0A803NUQ9_CANSA